MTECEKMCSTYRQIGNFFHPILKLKNRMRCQRRMVTTASAIPKRASLCALLQFALCRNVE